MSASPWTPVDESASAWEPVHEEPKPQPGFFPQLGSAIASRFGLDMPPEEVASAGRAVGSDLGNMARGMVDPKQGLLNAATMGMGSSVNALMNAPQTAQHYQQQKKAGYSLPYRLATPVAENLGVNVGGMEQGAKAGDTGAVLGHAATVPLTMAATEGLTRGVAPAINRIVPSTTRAGAGLAALESPEAYGSHPIEPSLATTKAAKLAGEIEATPSVKMHPLIEDFNQRMQAADTSAMRSNPQVAAQLEAAGIPQQNPLTFGEARNILKQVDNALSGSLDATHRQQLQGFSGALRKDIMAGTGVPSDIAPKGFQQDYQRMINESRRGHKIIRAGEEAGPLVGGAAGAAIGRQIGGLPGAAEGAAAGTIAGRYIGKPIIGGLTRAIIEREAGAPNIGNPPTPPATGVTAAPGERRISNAGMPESTNQRSGVERRDLAARDAFSKLSPEDQYKAAYTNKVTGLPNERAFEQTSGWRRNPDTHEWEQTGSASGRVLGMTDVAGLKALNEEYKMAGGNQLLRAAGKAMQDAGLEVSHTGGDEFNVIGQHGESPAQVAARLEQANQNLGNTALEVMNPKTGEKELYKGASFRHGVGMTPDEAEAGMLQQKAADKANARGTKGKLYKVTQ